MCVDATHSEDLAIAYLVSVMAVLAASLSATLYLEHRLASRSNRTHYQTKRLFTTLIAALIASKSYLVTIRRQE